MSTTLKPPPKFVTNEWAWGHTLDKLREKGLLDDGGNPTNYGAAVAIYKRVAAKYGDPDPRRSYESRELTRAELLKLDGAIWFVARGSAWAANDAAHMCLTRHDGAVAEYAWHVELHTDDGTIDGRFKQATAEWLLRESPQALAWAKSLPAAA